MKSLTAERHDRKLQKKWFNIGFKKIPVLK